MSQQVLLQAKGLYTFPNHFSSVPNGALLLASNVVINRDNIVESRRGYKIYGTQMGFGSSTTAHQLLVYKSRILRHFGTNSGTTLDYDSGTVDGSGNEIFTSFSGTYAEVEQGLRIKGIESNGNFYFTTSGGIKKISVPSATQLVNAVISNSGGIKALDLKATLNPTTGFFTQESCVAYRLVWGVNDANNNLILGTPSSRTVLYNPLTALLAKDFNKLLVNLDTQANVNGISAQNYTSTYKVSPNTSAQTLQANLIALTSSIDSDTIITKAAIDTASGSQTGTVASLVFNSSISSVLKVGNQVLISGLSGGGTTATFNGTRTITALATTSVANDTIQFTMPSATFGSTVDVGGSVKRLLYTLISQPIALNSTPTTDQLLSMQTYYNTIVGDLQTELSGIANGSTFNSNNATTSSTVNLTFSIPQNVTTAYFYQIYRTALTTSGTAIALSSLDPGDEDQLVYEGNVSATDISSGTVALQDITPDSFRGANLYTNPQTGDGILQSNDIPPIATDITSFKGYTFYSNTITKHRISNFSMLSVTKLTSGQSTFTISDGVTSNTYTFVSGAAESRTVTTTTLGAVGGAGKYWTLNSANDETQYYVWYNVDAGNTDPSVAGKTGIQVAILHTDSATVIATKTKNVLIGYTDFTTSSSTNVVTVTNNNTGISTHSVDVTTGFSIALVTTGAGEDATNKKVLISSQLTPAQQVDESARSLVRVINKNASELVYAFYLSGPTDVPGLILLEARNLGQNTFYTLTDSVNTASQFNSNLTLAPAHTFTNSIANPTVVTSTAHGLTTGNVILISGSNCTPTIDGPRTVTVTGANTFTIPINVTVGGTLGGFTLLTSCNGSSNEVKPNRVYYSKFQQPEAVPIVNYLDIGPQDKKILRILALRDNVFIIKEEGIYSLSGTDPSSFTVKLFDSSTLCKAPDSAVVLNNLIYMYSSQGVATISDTGVSVISRPIEDALIKLSSSGYTNFSTSTFGVSYESDRSYYLFTVTNTTDTVATQCYRFNTFTNTWTNLNLSKRCGVLNYGDDKLYLGAADTNFIEQERKSFDRTDYADRELISVIGASSVNGKNITLPSITGVSVGDVFLQVQYLTINQYNNLLNKLDSDRNLARVAISTISTGATPTITTSVDHNLSTGDKVILTGTNSTPNINGTWTATVTGATTFTIAPTASITVGGNMGFARYSYYKNLLGKAGDNIRTNLTNLAAKLDGDPGIITHTYAAAISGYSTDFLSCQNAFNVIIGLLNNDAGTGFKNYLTSSGTVSQESNITAINTSTNVITLSYAYPIIQGTSTIYNHITTQVQWVPQFLQDVSMTKHVSEGTLIFEDSSFSQATVLYSSDLSANLESQVFNGNGNGIFGNVPYGTRIFGGNGSGIPFRTYIPREKQRCRYINCQFQHSIARESFALYGMSLTYNPISQRGYR